MLTLSTTKEVGSNETRTAKQAFLGTAIRTGKAIAGTSSVGARRDGKPASPSSHQDGNRKPWRKNTVRNADERHSPSSHQTINRRTPGFDPDASGCVCSGDTRT